MKTRSFAYLAVLSFAIFLFLAVVISVSSELDAADLRAAEWVNGFSLGAMLNTLLVAASLYGREYFWVGVVAVMLVLGDRRTKELALGLSVLFVAGILGGEVAKALIIRERPWLYAAQLLGNGTAIVSSSINPRVPLDTASSFPSGHALIVSIGAFYSLATFRRRWVASLLALEAALVCFSRVYVGAHYPTDVLAGIALGAAIALGGHAFGRFYVREEIRTLVGYIISVIREGPLRL